VAEDPAAASWRWNGRWKPIPQTHSTEWKEVIRAWILYS